MGQWTNSSWREIQQYRSIRCHKDNGVSKRLTKSLIILTVKVKTPSHSWVRLNMQIWAFRIPNFQPRNGKIYWKNLKISNKVLMLLPKVARRPKTKLNIKIFHLLNEQLNSCKIGQRNWLSNKINKFQTKIRSTKLVPSRVLWKNNNLAICNRW